MFTNFGSDPSARFNWQLSVSFQAHLKLSHAIIMLLCDSYVTTCCSVSRLLNRKKMSGSHATREWRNYSRSRLRVMLDSSRRWLLPICLRAYNYVMWTRVFWIALGRLWHTANKYDVWFQIVFVRCTTCMEPTTCRHSLDLHRFVF